MKNMYESFFDEREKSNLKASEIRLFRDSESNLTYMLSSVFFTAFMFITSLLSLILWFNKFFIFTTVLSIVLLSFSLIMFYMVYKNYVKILKKAKGRILNLP